MADTLGQYKLLERIAEGGMGEVFKAKLIREGGFEKTIAVKRMLPNLANQERFKERFICEAKLSARLTHANIVHIYDFGHTGGSLFLAMEYVDGIDLGSFLARLKEAGERLPAKLAAEIAVSALKGLDYAHRLKTESGEKLDLIHRDISPSNILISMEGEIKLTDFGLAGAKEEIKEEDALAGKLAYLPPEAVRGEPMDRRSDIYSLGLVFYEMIFGRKAFPDGIPKEALFSSIVTGAIDFPTLDEERAPLCAIVERATDKEKACRYSTAREMERELTKAMAKLPEPKEELHKLLARLYPNEAKERKVLPEVTILSSKPMSPEERAKLQASEKTEISDEHSETPSKEANAKATEKDDGLQRRPRRWSLVFLSVLLLLSILAWLAFQWMPKHASLEIKSTPPSAKIFLDGKETNRLTPAVFDSIRADRPHKIELRLKHFEPHQEEITLSEGEEGILDRRLERSLQPSRLETIPEGAKAWLNNEPLEAPTPTELGKLAVGVKHELRIVHKGYVPVDTQFIIDEKKPGLRTFRFRLESIYANVTVFTDPKDTNLYVDGKRQKGQSPFLVKGLIPSREVRMTASRKGFTSQSISLIPAEREEPLRFTLSPWRAVLQMKADNAEILIQGKNHGNKATIGNLHESPKLFTILPKGIEGRLVVRIGVRQFTDSVGRTSTRAQLNIDAQPWASWRIGEGAMKTTPSSNQVMTSGRHALHYKIGNNPKMHVLELVLR